VLVYVVAGQPGRIPELLSLQYMNTDCNCRRNIYIQNSVLILELDLLGLDGESSATTAGRLIFGGRARYGAALG
jgi:hypothetical protein